MTSLLAALGLFFFYLIAFILPRTAFNIIFAVMLIQQCENDAGKIILLSLAVFATSFGFFVDITTTQAHE